MAKIESVSSQKKSLIVGTAAQKDNEVVFTIDVTGKTNLFLIVHIPTGENGIIRKTEDANDIAFRLTRLPLDANESMTGRPRGSEDETKFLAFLPGDQDDGLAIPDGETAKFELRIGNILCNAKMGKADIQIISSEDLANPKPVTIEKLEPKEQDQANPILYFIAEPSLRISKGDLTLRWQVRGNLPVKVTNDRGAELRIQDGAVSCQDTIERTTTYTLQIASNKDQTSNKYENFRSQYTVNVWGKGWDELQPFKTAFAYAYPNVLFDTAGRAADDDLYALFARVGAKSLTALCKSQDGLTGWQVINEFVPPGMESSPGVRQEDCLWLIGGSAADPERKSKNFWYFITKKPELGWQQAKVEGADAFERRMGHACVSMRDGSILVLGGLGQYRCLNDVWSFKVEPDGTEKKKLRATQLNSNSPWKPRCMFAALEQGPGNIWVCGGVDSPNGQPVGDLWSHGFNNHSVPWEWEPRTKGGNDTYPTADAIAAGVARRNDGLVAVLAERQGGNQTKTKPVMWELNDITSTRDSWRVNTYPLKWPVPKDDWTVLPHSITAVLFKERLFVRYLHRNALLDKANEAPALYVYIW
jgi:hypothetical protein